MTGVGRSYCLDEFAMPPSLPQCTRPEEEEEKLPQAKQQPVDRHWRQLNAETSTCTVQRMVVGRGGIRGNK